MDGGARLLDSGLGIPRSLWMGLYNLRGRRLLVAVIRLLDFFNLGSRMVVIRTTYNRGFCYWNIWIVGTVRVFLPLLGYGLLI